MRRASAAILVLIGAGTACGIAADGPSPRYAEAPAEPTRRSDATDVVRVTPSAVPDGGPPDGGVVSGSADAAVATQDAGPPGLVLATGPLTREQWDQMLAIGRGKVNRVCSECHGTGIGPTLNGRRRTADRVRQMVRQGGGDMRRISTRRVDDQELEGVIVFLSTINAVVDVSPPAQ